MNLTRTCNFNTSKTRWYNYRCPSLYQAPFLPYPVCVANNTAGPHRTVSAAPSAVALRAPQPHEPRQAMGSPPPFVNTLVGSPRLWNAHAFADPNKIH